jgi:hypothetical protein
MRELAALISLSFILASGVMAAEKPHPHRAMAQPGPAARAGCLDQLRLSVEHTAYVPTADIMPPRCGKLLSTDTLVAPRHWNQT